MNSTAVTLKLDFLSEGERINLGETVKLDCDGNGKDDMSITVDSVNTASQSASLTFKELSESQEDETDHNLSLALMMIFVIIVVFAVVIILKKR